MKTPEAIAYLQPIADSSCVKRYSEALNLAISALKKQRSLAETQATSEWISVKERRPEYKKPVLFVGEDGAVHFATDSVDWPDGGVSFCAPASGKWERGTHWMPLPEPPKEA